jgi:hypothetical protein
MKRKLLNAAAALLLAAPLAAQKAPPAEPPAWEGAVQGAIKTGDITVVTPVSGIATAQETYDVFAPFDGRVEEIHAELFSFATVKTTLARMVSTEMAALLDSSTEDSRKQTARRWKDVYEYTEIKPETQGVVTNVYAEPRTKVNKGDRLFTIAKKVVVIGRNTEPLYSALAAGMTAKVSHTRTGAGFDTRLVNFLKLKGSPLHNRVWLEVLNLKDGIKIGEQFDGTLFVGKSEDAMLVPRAHLVGSGGRRFLITEVKTGLETALETEILGHSSVYLQPPGAVEAKDGKNQKVR